LKTNPSRFKQNSSARPISVCTDQTTEWRSSTTSPETVGLVERTIVPMSLEPRWTDFARSGAALSRKTQWQVSRGLAALVLTRVIAAIFFTSPASPVRGLLVDNVREHILVSRPEEWRIAYSGASPVGLPAQYDKHKEPGPSNLDKTIDAYLLWICLWDRYPSADNPR
jgi:hypothetical protein